jgi:hypothetical protein
MQVGDLVLVEFTDAVCRIEKIEYEYGRTQIYLSHYNKIEDIKEITIVSSFEKLKPK